MRAMRERAFSGRYVSILRHDRGVTGIGRRCVKVERRAQAKGKPKEKFLSKRILCSFLPLPQATGGWEQPP